MAKYQDTINAARAKCVSQILGVDESAVAQLQGRGGEMRCRAADGGTDCGPRRSKASSGPETKDPKMTRLYDKGNLKFRKKPKHVADEDVYQFVLKEVLARTASITSMRMVTCLCLATIAYSTGQTTTMRTSFSAICISGSLNLTLSWCVTIWPCALDPLSGSFQLKCALGKVVHYTITCDMRERAFFIYVLRFFAVTTPSSTSQSVFCEFLGITTSSFGPHIAEVAFMKSTGSAGTPIPDSAAWSE
jgi:hypothetical protein